MERHAVLLAVLTLIGLQTGGNHIVLIGSDGVILGIEPVVFAGNYVRELADFDVADIRSTGSGLQGHQELVMHIAVGIGRRRQADLPVGICFIPLVNHLAVESTVYVDECPQFEVGTAVITIGGYNGVIGILSGAVPGILILRCVIGRCSVAAVRR